ncbi:MAG: GNAT family N-acetyltransferase, partial [Ruaniaceae bacterium]|nr:GNAT family N-acetyltransferase [Ruaniaceae bacterium]
MGGDDAADVRALCERYAVTAILAAQNLERPNSGSKLLLVGDPGEVRAIAWSGHNLVPVGDLEAMSLFARHLKRRPRRATSIVGEAAAVAALWGDLEGSWGPARDSRPNQPALVIRADSVVPGDDRVRVATPHDYELLFPAAVAMFTEEVGYDPTRTGGGYPSYVRGLIEKGHAYLVIEPVDGVPTVIFKADIGALWGGMAQIQGVWTHPHVRRQGIATAAMSEVVRLVRRDVAPVVSLYVNDHNVEARRVYEKVGFLDE